MSLLPRSLSGRLILVLVFGLTLIQLVTVGILLQDRGDRFYQRFQRGIVTRTVAIIRLLNSLPQEDRRSALAALNEPDLRISLHQRARATGSNGGTPHPAAILVARQLQQQLPPGNQIRVTVNGQMMSGVPPSNNRHMEEMMQRMPMMHRQFKGMGQSHLMASAFLIQARLDDGSWVRIEHALHPDFFNWPLRLLLVLGTLLLSIVALSLLAVRWITRPLKQLARAADELGRDIHRPPLSEQGPREVREAAQAFNCMQQRLSRYLDDRNRILTAISHDLKTPVTRLRLRSELLDDTALGEKFQQDLDDMEEMIRATLDFMRGEDAQEPQQPIDILALLESLQEDIVESGGNMGITGKPQRPYPGRPLALKRCINNLIGNAIRYGGDCEVRIEDGADTLTLIIRDHGPGIPETEMGRMFEPFYRVEKSRSKETGGSGLGLGIARNIARSHGGEVTLQNHPDGGLQVTLSLPR